MILLDYSQVVIGSFMAVSKGEGVVEEDTLRHVILNNIRKFRNQFSSKYGEMVICCDHRKNWRKEIFPNYKASRHKLKQDSGVDWQYLYECLNIMRDDLKEYFPYKVVYVESAEADDIIGVLTNHFNGLEKDILPGEQTLGPTLIISSDKDFIQLQKFNKVKQWSPLQKKWVIDDPHESLYEKVIKGDTGDGVPNILSGDDVFITEGARQKPITKKKLDSWRDQNPKDFCGTEEILRNYYRNEQLVDLSKIPETICINIVNNYTGQSSGDRSQLMNYFVSKRLKNLMEYIEEF